MFYILSYIEGCECFIHAYKISGLTVDVDSLKSFIRLLFSCYPDPCSHANVSASNSNFLVITSSKVLKTEVNG